MVGMVKRFGDLSDQFRDLAGGKGSVLARMYQGGYPVPDGFVIFPSAFEGGKLKDKAWSEIQDFLGELRGNDPDVRFAVRSSASGEDSAQASFAGEFETVLDVKTDGEIRKAIDTVFRSEESERVKTYRSVQGMEQSRQIAVVVMRMVRSELSGVLFTADPITGSHRYMTGNYVYGLGERLVSGEADADSFKLKRPKGTYEGPADFRKYASRLYRYASRLVREFGSQQDIEWAVEKEKLYLLQARPITTVNRGNLDTYDLNDSLDGDFLWCNTNVGEAMSGVFSPLSWSLIREIDEEQSTVPGSLLFSGNICGRLYSNISMLLSIYPAFGRDPRPTLKRLGDIFGQFPEGIEIPVYPFAPLELLKAMIPKVHHTLKKIREGKKIAGPYLKETPEWCRAMKIRIGRVEKKDELLSLWKNELWPYNLKAFWVGNAQARRFESIFRLNQELIGLLGTEDANALLSDLRGNSELASLGPVIGISKIVRGEMSREEYLEQQGHRSPHEFELSIPDPSEDAGWLDRQIEGFKKSGADIEGLLNRQEARYEDAWERFQKRFPEKAKRMEKRLAEAAEGSRSRETYRSEWTRVFRVNRAFALRAGELTGIGEDVFFLYLDDLLELLAGEDSALQFIEARKANYDRFRELPPLPSMIRGRFEPSGWLTDPNRRADFYDPAVPVETSDSELLKGFAGAAGRIEGTVRVLIDPEEGEELLPGEILVASTTNIGWTPLFPKAAAIVTDIGAPLSHAAIVARELGIPAVVGCGNATARLKTGDRVVVDGGHGVVRIIHSDSD